MENLEKIKVIQNNSAETWTRVVREKAEDKTIIGIDEKIFQVISKYDENMQRKEIKKYLETVGYVQFWFLEY